VPYSPETKIVRNGVVKSGVYSPSDGGFVTLTVEADGITFTVYVHPDTAAKFHCGAQFTMTLAIVNVP
jgi:hypothetical protein